MDSTKKRTNRVLDNEFYVLLVGGIVVQRLGADIVVEAWQYAYGYRGKTSHLTRHVSRLAQQDPTHADYLKKFRGTYLPSLGLPSDMDLGDREQVRKLVALAGLEEKLELLSMDIDNLTTKLTRSRAFAVNKSYAWKDLKAISLNLYQIVDRITRSLGGIDVAAVRHVASEVVDRVIARHQRSPLKNPRLFSERLLGKVLDEHAKSEAQAQAAAKASEPTAKEKVRADAVLDGRPENGERFDHNGTKVILPNGDAVDVTQDFLIGFGAAKLGMPLHLVTPKKKLLTE